jgi:hypothetical protein
VQLPPPLKNQQDNETKEAAVICTHTPSWVRPGTERGKILTSVGRTRERQLKSKLLCFD